MKSVLFASAVIAWLPAIAPAQTVKVTPYNFNRAESDVYFAKMVKDGGGTGKFFHDRLPTQVDKQPVIRMNRDTLYSSAVFDLDAGPVTITLPNAGSRFMSLQLVNEDHYVPGVYYKPGKITLTRKSIGTRYVAGFLRIFMDPASDADIKTANGLQDAVLIEQASPGRLEIPSWDPETLDKTRSLLLGLAQLGGEPGVKFGKKSEVDPISWLIATAAGWAGNPPRDAQYAAVFPPKADGTTAYTLTLKDVPVDGFWSITAYDAKGFMYENPQAAYSVNNVTAHKDADGSVTIQFGGDPATAKNYLPITPGWNCLLRLYRPRAAVLNGTWKMPSLVEIK